MRRLIAFVLVSVLAIAPLAWAGQIEGKVKSVDQSDRTVTLEDGTRIVVPQGMDLDQLREGAEITMSYEEKDGKNEATNVQVK